jgi:4-amino-4-deoxy-L-arabinose transferase-like glycosyltransferase
VTGFFAYGYLFLHLLGNIAIVPTLMTISCILLTMLIIFEIGRVYKNDLMGLVGAALYAFNPLVFAYSNRLLPDIFTTMLLSLGIFLLLLNRERSRWYLYIEGGAAVALGIFFGYQASFTIIAYVVFLLVYLLIRKQREGLWNFLLSLVGVAIPILLWLYLQYTIYANPFSLVSEASGIYQIVSMYPWSQNYYLSILFPFSTNATVMTPAVWTPPVGSFWEPPTSAGLLGIFFIVSNLLLLSKKWRKTLLPFSAAALILFLYLMFGTQSFTTYTHVYDENRFIMPIILLASVGSGMGIASLSDKKLRAVAAIVIVYIYVLYSLPVYNLALSFYTPHGYALLNRLQSSLPYQSMGSYKIHQDIFSVSDALCFIFNTTASNCYNATMHDEPNETTLAMMCSQSRTLILTKEGLCNNSTVLDGAYIHVTN